MSAPRSSSRIPIPFVRRRPLVPLVRLEGAISPTPSRFDRALSLAGVEDALDKAFSIRRAAAVALVVNSPGGAPVQSGLIAQRIRQLAERDERTVLVFCEDVAASGGYWIALAGDEIYAAPGSIVGSIGVVSATFGFTGLMEKAGVERRMYTAGERKALLDPFSPEDPDDVARLRKLQAGLHDQFKAQVRARRGDRLATDDDTLFNGDVWLGEEARALGLVDGIGEVRGVLRGKYGDDVRVKTIGVQKKPFLARLLSGGASAVAGEVEHRAGYARYGL